MKNDFLNKCLLQLKNNKLLKILLIILLLLIFVSIVFIDNKKQNISNEDTVDKYVKNMENSLTEILSKIDGAGKVSVMITIDSGMETVLASTKNVKETESGKITEETPILVNGKTVILKENYPQINGAVIVCEGANKISVVNSIVNATSTLLNIEKNNIQIIKMK